MCLLFESIRVQDGELCNLHFHQQRLNRAMQMHYPQANFHKLKDCIEIPAKCFEGIYKCRVTYGREVKNIDFEPYNPRVIRTLKLLEENGISYPHKYADRSLLNALRQKRGKSDEILIVKNGLITDTSFSNIIFFDGSTWLTPSTPLLIGTMRSMLLEQGSITEREIRVADLHLFQKARLINAMLPPETGTDIAIEAIAF